MTASITSNSWHRVAALRPRLRTQARLYRHRYRDEVWYLLQDPASGRVHRFTPQARLVIAAMNGKRSVEELWELTNRHLGDDAPTQDEMIRLLGQLHATDLLQSDVTPDTAEIFQRGERQDKAARRRSWANPMALRIPLWDPDAFLNRAFFLARYVWGPWGAVLWLAVVLPALLLVALHWQDLTHNFSDQVLAVDNLLLLWLVFPVIKALHELGHAFATKAGGGEVHDMGLMFLVLMPVPYVEASAATVFKDKYQRALVGAAGMLVEIFIAALALYVWLLAEPGMLRAVMFNVMLVAGVSTVIFNGNPLLRYDAYYILVDLIEMPNLAQRSLRYWGYVLERYVLRIDDAEAQPASAGERAWFLFYGLASTVYRTIVTVSIALFIAGEFFVVGVLLACWALATMALMPVGKAIRYLATSPRLHKHRRRALVIFGFVGCAIVVFAVAVPVPFRSQAEGVVWLPEEALIRAGGNGFVQTLLVQPGSRVSKGGPLIQSQDPALDSHISLIEARVQELEASYAAQFVASPSQTEILRQQLHAEQATLARAREKGAALVASAGSDGVFVAPQSVDMPGRFHRKGDLLGYVTERGAFRARVVVSQGDIDVVRLATDRVQVRLAQRVDQPMEGRIVRQIPAGESRLPSRALAREGGGQITVDPHDTQGTRTLERVFQFDVELPAGQPLDLFGERVHVRFEHPWEPLATQGYRAVRRLFLTRFHV